MTAAFAFALANNGNDVIATGVGVAQVGAAPLTGGINQITSPTGATAFILPQNAGPGAAIVVANATGSTAAALVFPPVGGAISRAAANASFSVAAAKAAIFYPHPNGLDFTVVLSA